MKGNGTLSPALSLKKGEGEDRQAGPAPIDFVSTESEFLEAAFPAPVRLLGQDLEPYSLIHEMLLRQHRNLFLDQAGPGPTSTSERILSHLFFGVFICCHAYPEVLSAVRRPDLPEISQEWRRKCGKHGKNGIDEAVERVRSFRRYVREGQVCPEFDPVKRRGARPSRGGSPWLLRLFKTLTGQLNFSPSEAYNCPYGYAQWLYLGHWETEGTVRIVTNEEKQLEKVVHLEAARLGLKVMRFTKASEGAQLNRRDTMSAEKKEGK